MRALVYQETGLVLDNNYPQPEPRNGEDLIRVLLAGICYTISSFAALLAQYVVLCSLEESTSCSAKESKKVLHCSACCEVMSKHCFHLKQERAIFKYNTL